MKNKLFLVGIGLSVFGFLFQSQIKDLFLEDIVGCMDPIASNYNEEATIDDDSCTFEKPLSADLFDKIKNLKESEWDKDEYINLRAEIFFYFTSIQQSNSGQEKISLNKLDMAYMFVLEGATDNAILYCFTSISELKKEVRKFYDIFKKENTAIKAAQYSFNSHSKFYGLRTKVNKLLEKRFVQSDLDVLKEKVNKFSNSKSFSEFKECKKLTNIISDAISRLDKFEAIDKNYNKFEKDYENKFFDAKDFVSKRYFHIFKDYKWYYNKVIETDERVKKEKKERDEQKRKKKELEMKIGASKK